METLLLSYSVSDTHTHPHTTPPGPPPPTHHIPHTNKCEDIPCNECKCMCNGACKQIVVCAVMH